MFKKILLTLLTLTSLTANEAYLNVMDSLIEDALEIESALVDKSLASLSSDSSLEKKLNEYEQKTTFFLKVLGTKLSDESIALAMLDKTETLSASTLSLSTSIIALADTTGQNANDSYLKTLETLSTTTLRLSDDIGVMADRIGEMADRIGEMADRIVETEKIITQNNTMINDSMMSVINKFEFSQTQQGQTQMQQQQMQMSTPSMQMPAQNMQKNLPSTPMPAGRF
ncbi:hypothetical protein MNB_SM-4-509 [hydrothermal vent metagenome]|uniref:Uncharacterized protein n=1 Tax=hydrothermal vent metagenome TaxID=652676 RepID=A0A1W1BCC8_9ZZZZ